MGNRIYTIAILILRYWQGKGRIKHSRGRVKAFNMYSSFNL